MYSHHHIRKLLGQHVHCHTHYGVFEGVILHCTKDYVILAPAGPARLPAAEGWAADAAADGRPFFGPGPGGPVGPGGGPMGPGPGPGWHLAIPLAAILGITAVGMHWW
ncbi:MAG: hypothetical protein K6T78_08310 [Alicyclobacillus sp.]|nr:hypothetical protein [Alicyclobacillus sp.]